VPEGTVDIGGCPLTFAAVAAGTVDVGGIPLLAAPVGGGIGGTPPVIIVAIIILIQISCGFIVVDGGDGGGIRGVLCGAGEVCAPTAVGTFADRDIGVDFGTAGRGTVSAVLGTNSDASGRRVVEESCQGSLVHSGSSFFSAVSSDCCWF